LIGSVQGKSEAIRFTAGFNRTRANAEAFCTEHGVPLKDSLDEILADPNIDAVIYATPHSEHGAQVRTYRCRRQARVHGEAVHARPGERRPRG